MSEQKDVQKEQVEQLEKDKQALTEQVAQLKLELQQERSKPQQPTFVNTAPTEQVLALQEQNVILKQTQQEYEAGLMYLIQKAHAQVVCNV